MSFLRNHQIKALAKKATENVIAQLVNYLEFNEQVTSDGKKRMTENEALTTLFYIFMTKNNLTFKNPPQDKKLYTLIAYVTELVNLEIPVFENQKDLELISETVLSSLKNQIK